MSSVDFHLVGNQLSAPAAVAPPRGWGKTSLRVIGGFVLTGIFLAISAAIGPLALVYSFIWFAKLS